MHVSTGSHAFWRPAARTLSVASLPAPVRRQSTAAPAHPHIPVIRTLPALRRWRRDARARGLDVGVVPTGHLDLVKTSLARHPLTVMTLFVNPMQFAPTEDLSAYPRTFEGDLAALRTLLPPAETAVRGLGVSEHDRRAGEDNAGPAADRQAPLVVFAPTDDVMYPLRGELQDLGQHRGVSVDVRGWGDVMEGASRPQFFKGVATVCTKLFNAVEPDHAYFGQKDIQQALLLKIMLTDLLMAHPTPQNLHILPTTRAPDGLALSSRNAYLTPAERAVAPVLARALAAARDAYDAGRAGEDVVGAATAVVLDEQERVGAAEGIAAGADAVELRLDYFEVFDRHTFEPVRGPVGRGKELVVAGAVWVGKTRLIDNLLLGWGFDE